MKRQTKKGPRRSRAMPVVGSGVWVSTTYSGCRYVTAGKVYKQNPDSCWSFGIKDDFGDEICIRCPGSPCGHLDHIGVWDVIKVPL